MPHDPAPATPAPAAPSAPAAPTSSPRPDPGVYVTKSDPTPRETR